ALNALADAKVADKQAATLLAEIDAVGLSLQPKETSLFTLSVDSPNTQMGSMVRAQLPAVGQALLTHPATTVDLDGKVVTRLGPPQPVKPGMISAKYVIRSMPNEQPATFTLEMHLPPPDGNTTYLREVLQPQMVVLRGIVEMAVGRPRLFELAEAEQGDV